MKRIAITGFNAINPAGIGHEEIWNNVILGNNFIKKIDRFDSSRFSSQVGGEIKEFQSKDFISRRLIKKIDRFTQLALATSQLAIDEANLNLKELDRSRIGIMVGNAFGGWEFAEKELRNFWSEANRVSPYQATAWFQTAAQGQITIQHGIKGRSRTLIADRASGATAILEAIQTIQRDKADVMLAGGSEAPFSPFGWLCCQTSGYLADTTSEPNPEKVYRPFDYKHKGSVFGEGSSFIILEDWEHAVKRGAKIYAEITGWSITNDAYYPYNTVRPDGELLTTAINKSMKKANLQPKEIDYISAHGSALPSEDATEVLAYKKVFNTNLPDIPISIPKSTFGHLIGAAAPVDIMLTVKALQTSIIPPTINHNKAATGFEEIRIKTNKTVKHIKHALVISRGMGANLSFIISKV